MEKTRFKSIKTKLLLAFLSLSLIPLIALGLSGIIEVTTMGGGVSNQVSTELTEKAKVELDNVAANTSDKVGLHTRQYENDISAMAKFPEIESAFKARTQGGNWVDSPARGAVIDYTLSVLSSRPDMTLVRLSYQDGTTIAKVFEGKSHLIDKKTGKIEYRGDKYWFTNAMDPNKVKSGSNFVSSINMGRTTNKPEIHYASPVFVDNQRVGLVVIAFAGEAITKAVADTKFGKSGFAFMVDKSYETMEGKPVKEGVYVYHPKYKACDEENPGTIVDVDKLKGDSGFVSFNDEGKEWTAAYHRVPVDGRDWYVFAALPKAEIVESVNTIENGIQASVADLNRNFLLLLLFSAIIVFAAALIISSQITKPIAHLTEVAEKVSMGNTNVEVDVDSNDEIGGLADSFRRMVVSIKILMGADDVDKSA